MIGKAIEKITMALFRYAARMSHAFNKEMEDECEQASDYHVETDKDDTVVHIYLDGNKVRKA